MLIALAISTLIYVLVGTVAVGLVGPARLADSSSPLEEAMKATGNLTSMTIISIGGLLATASVLLTSVLGVSRMIYAMARRKDLPEKLGKLHPRHNTPTYSTLIVGVAMTLLVLFFDLSRVVAISTFGLLFFYTLANVSALRLKTQNRRYPKVFPAAGAITCLVMLVFLLFASLQAWIIGTSSLLVGAVYYVAKQRLNSRAKPSK